MNMKKNMRPDGRKRVKSWPILIAALGVASALLAAAEFKFPGDIFVDNVAGPRLVNTLTTSTVPVVIPQRGAMGDGLGSTTDGGNCPALIESGVLVAEFCASTMYVGPQTGGGTTLNIRDEGLLGFSEEQGNGSNILRFKAPASLTANQLCEFENDSAFIPDSCVGNSVDNVGYDEVLEEGSGLTKRAQLNFIGSNVTCVDNAGRTECTFTAPAGFSDSAGLRALLSDENGTGAALFDGATSPNFGTTVTVGGKDACLEDGTNCLVTENSTNTLTNKTIDPEGSGNAIGRLIYVPLRPVTCQSSIPLLNWDYETTNTPAASCITGSNTQKGYADFDQTTDECLQWTGQLPSTWTGAIDADYAWMTTATSGSVAWCMQIICVGNTETDDPAFPAQASGNCVTDAAHGTTNQMNFISKTGISASGCAASEEMHVRLCRDPNETGGQTDTVAADARLADVQLKMRVTE
jgi:hypothetical protein